MGARTPRASRRNGPMPVVEALAPPMPVVGRARLSDAARAGRGASLGKRRTGLPKAAASASKVVQRAESEAAALASITPFARGTDSPRPW
jgi:hypothetical protein